MNRRQLIKRGIAGSVAALVGLPEQKYLKGEIKDMQVFDKALSAPEAKAAYRGPEPAMTIRRAGDFRLYRKIAELPVNETVPGGTRWRTYKLGATFMEVSNLWVTDDEWNKLHSDNLVRLELTSDDYDVIGVGFCTGCVVTAWMDGPTPDGAAKYYGDFTFRLIEPIEEIVVNRQFPSDQDGGDIWGNGNLRIYNPRDIPK